MKCFAALVLALSSADGLVKAISERFSGPRIINFEAAKVLTNLRGVTQLPAQCGDVKLQIEAVRAVGGIVVDDIVRVTWPKITDFCVAFGHASTRDVVGMGLNPRSAIVCHTGNVCECAIVIGL